MPILKASFVGMGMTTQDHGHLSLLVGNSATNRLVCCELCGAMITWKKLSEASSSCEAFCLNASSMQVGDRNTLDFLELWPGDFSKDFC